MTAADTADYAAILTGVVFWFWVLGQIIEGKASRKWKRIKRHQPRWER